MTCSLTTVLALLIWSALVVWTCWRTLLDHDQERAYKRAWQRQIMAGSTRRLGEVTLAELARGGAVACAALSEMERRWRSLFKRRGG